MTLVESNFAGKIIVTMGSEQIQPPDVLTLTARMSRGEEAAFQEFYSLYFNRLLRYLFVVADGREEIAREALQLAFVRVARHVRRFDSEAAFWNWLAMLARNCVIDENAETEAAIRSADAFFQQRPAVWICQAMMKPANVLKNSWRHGAAAGLPPGERALLERKCFC